MHRFGLSLAKLAVAVLAVLTLLLPVVTVSAQDGAVINDDINKAVGDLEIPKDTTVNGNVTLNIGDLKIFGIVNGDVGSNMGRVSVYGDVNGNIETNMGALIVDGNVSGNVKTRMGEVIIGGSVGGNVETDLGEASITGSVGGDIGSGFGELTINGAVAGDVYSKGGLVTINGIVEGDVTLEQGVVELGPAAIVAGRVYVDRGLIRKSDSSQVGSSEIREELAVSDAEEAAGDPGYRFDGVDDSFISSIADRIVREVDSGLRDAGFAPRVTGEWGFYRNPFAAFYGSAARGVINMLIIFALTALTYTLFPGQVKVVGSALTAKPGPVVGWGLLAVILAVPLMIVLAITIIGIPLIIVEIVLLVAAGILGYSGLALLIGERITSTAFSREVNPLAAIGLAVLAIGLIALIPIIGWIVSLAVFVLSIGAALATRFGTVDPGNREINLPVETGGNR